MAKLTKKAVAQLREHLGAKSTADLVDLVMAEVESNPVLKDRLLLEIAATGGPLDVASFRRSFSDALRSKSAGRRDYPRTSGAWARGVHAAIESFQALLAAGQADAVVSLCEYALGRIDKTMGEVDDSSGYFSMIVSELERLHHEACLVGQPDTVALAGRLFAFEVDSGWDIFIDSVEHYADVLGEPGLDEMRRLAEERWATIPAKTPGAGYDTTPGRFHLERMMEKLATIDGDVDARVEVMARDLSHAYDFLEIAQVLAEAGRPDDALDWARRGLNEFADDPRGPDTRLDDFVLAALEERGEPDLIEALVWKRFDARPNPATYVRLRTWTQTIDRWDDLRPAALKRLHADAEDAAATATTARATAQRRWGSHPPSPPAYETLIEVLLDDDDLDEAWQLATDHRCTQRLWMRLAKAREHDHPDDAVAVYRREIEQLIDRKQTHTYEAAVVLVAHVGELLRTAGDEAGFAAFVAEISNVHKAKTKFLRILSEAGL